MRRWNANFDPNSASVEKAAVWVRLPGISMEFYDDEFLKIVGSPIAKPFKVNFTTEEAINTAKVCSPLC